MGGYDLGMLEVNEAADQIEKAADKDAIVIFGASVKEELQDEIIITVIATGFEDDVLGSSNRENLRPDKESDRTEKEEEADQAEFRGDQTEELENEFDKRYNTDFAIPSFLNRDKSGRF